MRYRGVNPVSPRGLRTHVTLIRTLRSYMEGHLYDLFDIRKFAPVVIERDDDRGSDDVIEAPVTINDQAFVFRIEPTDDAKLHGFLASAMRKPA